MSKPHLQHQLLVRPQLLRREGQGLGALSDGLHHHLPVAPQPDSRFHRTARGEKPDGRSLWSAKKGAKTHGRNGQRKNLGVPIPGLDLWLKFLINHITSWGWGIIWPGRRFYFHPLFEPVLVVAQVQRCEPRALDELRRFIQNAPILQESTPKSSSANSTFSA